MCSLVPLNPAGHYVDLRDHEVNSAPGKLYHSDAAVVIAAFPVSFDLTVGYHELGDVLAEAIKHLFFLVPGHCRPTTLSDDHPEGRDALVIVCHEVGVGRLHFGKPHHLAALLVELGEGFDQA